MKESSLTPDEEFANALRTLAPRFGASLTAADTARLLDYYQLVTAWNQRLHLVAPCAPASLPSGTSSNRCSRCRT